MSPPQQTKIVNSEETAITKQWLGKQVPAATNTSTQKEMFCVVFSVLSMLHQIFNI
jgi:hypothetical protein